MTALVQDQEHRIDFRFRSGRRSRKLKDLKQAEKIFEDWDLRVKENPNSIYERDYIHGIDCRDYGCNCTYYEESETLNDVREKERREQQGIIKGTYKLTDKQLQRIKSYQEQKQVKKEPKPQYDLFFTEDFEV